MSTLLASRQVVLPGHPEPVAATVEVDGGHVAAVHPGITRGAELLEGALLPGFVDTHCHGAAGAAFTDAEPDAVRAAIGHHRRHGSTTLFASTVTAGLDELAGQVARLRPLVQSGELAGIHLEGPFISPLHKGAHAEDLLVAPTPQAIDALLAAGGGAVRMVTLAPELPGGQAAVAQLHAAGVVAAFGHSDADAEATRRSIEAGVRVATHLFNAMRPLHHRAPGPVPVLLTDPRVVVELVCDFVHLAPEVVELAGTAAGAARVALVTDAMSATGCPDGAYQLGSLPVQVTGGVARLATADGRPGAIAGSTLTMDVAVANLVRRGVGLVAASTMASATPARAHGLARVGRIAPGCLADLCLLGGDASLRAVMRHGRWIEGR